MSIHDDPIELELFKNALFAIADEMALTVFRTTYSGVLKDNMDYSTAFCDADGKLVAQGLTLPGHLGSIPTALDVVVAKYRGDMAPGDVFVMNDPFEGGMHLPDIFAFKPLYHEGRRLAFAATVWGERYLGFRPNLFTGTEPDLYLLTDHVGVPFEQDGWRDGEHLREWMTGLFERELARRGVPWLKVTEDRFATAVTAVEHLMRQDVTRGSRSRA